MHLCFWNMLLISRISFFKIPGQVSSFTGTKWNSLEIPRYVALFHTPCIITRGQTNLRFLQCFHLSFLVSCHPFEHECWVLPSLLIKCKILVIQINCADAKNPEWRVKRSGRWAVLAYSDPVHAIWENCLLTVWQPYISELMDFYINRAGPINRGQTHFFC